MRLLKSDVQPFDPAEIKRRADVQRADWDKDLAQGKALAALAPVGAKFAVIAEQHEDDCDGMSDYYGKKTLRRCLIGWQFTTRQSFKTWRKAVAAVVGTLPEIAHLATPSTKFDGAHPNDEHRENYSMGGGLYLKAGSRYATGWAVRTTGVTASCLAGHENLLPAPTQGATSCAHDYTVVAGWRFPRCSKCNEVQS